ncbi:12189_t:CDS:1, partial [Racocetra fulgida]
LSARKKNLKENLYGFGWETDNAMEEKLQWIESKLIEYQHYKWLF